MQRDTENDSSSPGDSSDVTPNAGSWLSSSWRETSPQRTVNQLRNGYPGQSSGEIKKRLASLEKEKKLISLTQKLNEIEPEKQQDSQLTIALSCLRVRMKYLSEGRLFRNRSFQYLLLEPIQT